MKTSLFLTLALVVLLAVAPPTQAQKCMVIVKTTFVYEYAHELIHWMTIDDHDASVGYFRQIEGAGRIKGIRPEDNAQVCKVDARRVPPGYMIYRLADFATKKPMGWVHEGDVKEMKRCKKDGSK